MPATKAPAGKGQKDRCPDPWIRLQLPVLARSLRLSICRFADIIDLTSDFEAQKHLDNRENIHTANALITVIRIFYIPGPLHCLNILISITMPPFRNPFNKKPPIVNGVPTVTDENVRPSLGVRGDQASERSSYTGSRASSSLSIKPRKEETAEYKLSVVNDSGVYLPPSPPEKKSFWQKSPSSTMSSNHRSMLNENEPFSISRESFESYRRSFDISARSPVYPHESAAARQSLDSTMSRPSRSAVKSDSFSRPEPTNEDDECFEDVGLNDEGKQQPKRKSIFARFGDSSETPVTGDAPRPTSSHRGFHLPGRKRGQSVGQGAELGNIDRPATNGNDDGVVH